MRLKEHFNNATHWQQEWCHGLRERVGSVFHAYGLACASHPWPYVVVAVVTILFCSYPLSSGRMSTSPPLEFETSLETRAPSLRPSRPPTKASYPEATPARFWFFGPPTAYLQQVVVSVDLGKHDPRWFEFNRAATLSTISERLFDSIASHQLIQSDCMRAPARPILEDAVFSDLFAGVFPQPDRCLILGAASGSVWALLESYQYNAHTIALKELLQGSTLFLDELWVSNIGSSTSRYIVHLGVTIVLNANAESIVSEPVTRHRFVVDLEHHIRKTSNLPFISNASSLSESHPLKMRHVFFRDFNVFSLTPMILVYLMLLVYIYVSVSKIQQVKSQAGLALAAVAAIFSSFTMTLGICCHLDIHFTLFWSDYLPYLIILNGLEEIVGYTSAITRTPVALPVPARVAQGLASEASPCVKHFLMTATVSLIGICTSVPAIKEFSTLALIALIVESFLIVAFFVPILSVDLEQLHHVDESFANGTASSFRRTSSHLLEPPSERSPSRNSPTASLTSLAPTAATISSSVFRSSSVVEANRDKVNSRAYAKRIFPVLADRRLIQSILLLFSLFFVLLASWSFPFVHRYFSAVSDPQSPTLSTASSHSHFALSWRHWNALDSVYPSLALKSSYLTVLPPIHFDLWDDSAASHRVTTSPSSLPHDSSADQHSWSPIFGGYATLLVSAVLVLLLLSVILNIFLVVWNGVFPLSNHPHTSPLRRLSRDFPATLECTPQVGLSISPTRSLFSLPLTSQSGSRYDSIIAMSVFNFPQTKSNFLIGCVSLHGRVVIFDEAGAQVCRDVGIPRGYTPWCITLNAVMCVIGTKCGSVVAIKFGEANLPIEIVQPLTGCDGVVALCLCSDTGIPSRVAVALHECGSISLLTAHTNSLVLKSFQSRRSSVVCHHINSSAKMLAFSCQDGTLVFISYAATSDLFSPVPGYQSLVSRAVCLISFCDDPLFPIVAYVDDDSRLVVCSYSLTPLTSFSGDLDDDDSGEDSTTHMSTHVPIRAKRLLCSSDKVVVVCVDHSIVCYAFSPNELVSRVLSANGTQQLTFSWAFHPSRSIIHFSLLKINPGFSEFLIGLGEDGQSVYAWPTSKSTQLDVYRSSLQETPPDLIAQSDELPPHFLDCFDSISPNQDQLYPALYVKHFFTIPNNPKVFIFASATHISSRTFLSKSRMSIFPQISINEEMLNV